MDVQVTGILNKNTIGVFLAAVEAYAGQYFADKKEVRMIVLALEECLNNILLYSGANNDCEVAMDVKKGKFAIAVKDKALPGDFEEELKDEWGLGLELLHSIVDEYRLENLGFEGRRQSFCKYYEEKAGGDAVLDIEAVANDGILTISVPSEDNVNSLSKLYYLSFGFTYSWDLVYYPRAYLEAYRNGDIVSLLMCDENNVVRGHAAIFPNESIRGCYELGMILSDPRFRNRGISKRLIEQLLKNVDIKNMPMYYADCTIRHPFSQRAILKMGAVPTAFQFQTMPPEMYHTDFSNDEDYDSGVDLCMVYDKRALEVYLPLEVRAIGEHIYADLQLERKINCVEGSLADYSIVEAVYLTNNNAGIITIHQAGDDIETVLARHVFDLKKNEVRLVTIYCLMTVGCLRVYDYGKKEGFFFTGILPATSEGDVMIMQKLMSSVVDYDYLQLADECKWLLNEVRKLDPDYRQ